MSIGRKKEIGAPLRAEQPERTGARSEQTDGIHVGANTRIDRLIGVIEQQGKQIAELAVHVGLLVQAVAQLLGEEAGVGVQDEDDEPARVDLDGKPY